MIKLKTKTIEVLKICQSCRAFNYNGTWNPEEPPYLKEKDPEEEVYVQFRSCRECRLKELIYQYNSRLITK